MTPLVSVGVHLLMMRFFGRWEKGLLWGEGVIRAPLPKGGGGGMERGSRDRTLLNWQSEDQSWLKKTGPSQKSLTKNVPMIYTSK